MYDLATKNVQQFDQSAHVSIKHGDALEVIEQLVKEEMSYDFIFIDAAKAHYQQYFEAVQSLTKARTWIVCDNILFKGYVSGDSQADIKRLNQLTNLLHMLIQGCVAIIYYLKVICRSSHKSIIKVCNN